MTLGAIGIGRLSKGLLPVVAYAAGNFLRVIFLRQLGRPLFHLENLRMAFVALHCLMRCMVECYRVSARGREYDLSGRRGLNVRRCKAQYT